LTPIQELLSRIRWDREFGRRRFEIGYFDRHEGVIQRVGLHAITFPDDDHHAFEVADESGQIRRIPLHRVREVSKEGQIIWQRPAGRTTLTAMHNETPDVQEASR